MGVEAAFPEHYIRDLVAPWIVWKGSALGFDVLPRSLALETLGCCAVCISHFENCIYTSVHLLKEFRKNVKLPYKITEYTHFFGAKLHMNIVNVRF